MIINLIAFTYFAVITLFILYWGLTFIAQVKFNQFPSFTPVKKILNKVEKFEESKKQIVRAEELLRNG